MNILGKNKLLYSIIALILIVLIITSTIIFWPVGKLNENPATKIYGANSISSLQDVCYINTGSQYFQESSYDRNGGNGDAFGPSANLTLLDVTGPGQVTNIWFTWRELPETARLRFYFDGEETPRIDLTVEQMELGTIAPFLGKFSNGQNSSGGGWTFWAPITFEKGLKIVADDLNYWHLGYEMFSLDQKVESYNDSTDYTKALDALENSGQLSDAAKNANKVSGTGTLTNANDKITIAELSGSKRIYAVELKIPELADNLYASSSAKVERASEILTDISFRAYWDNEKYPSVDSEIGLMFAGSVYAAVPFDGYVFGLKEDGTLYCYLPMPFKKDAQLELVATGDVNVSDISWNVYYDEFNGPWEYTGYLNIESNEEAPVTPGEFVSILETKGMGHFVGIVQDVDAPLGNRAYTLEGDEEIYVDGKYTRSMSGTGTEDLYCGGWYYTPKADKPMPLCGLIDKFQMNGREKFMQFRMFVNEPITFRNEFKFLIEHGGGNDNKIDVLPDYKTAAFYYLIPDKIMKLTDELIINSDGKASNGYKVSNNTVNEAAGIVDIFDQEKVFIEYGNYFTNSKSSFKMNIKKNNSGVVLRRVLDCTVKNQKADVYVNGELVGTWSNAMPLNYDSGVSMYQSDFIIPQEFTRGKMSIKITIDNSKYADSEWTEFSYQAFSIPG